MIPKIIHYCWFGGKRMPRDMRRYIDGWKIHHPDFQFFQWSEENSPSGNAYLNNALQNGKWANAANFMRLYALNKQGGIYFDTDIEVLRPFDPLLHYPCFLGFEKRNAENDCINNAVLGAVEGHPFVKSCLEDLLIHFNGLEMANLSSPVLTTRILRSKSNLEYGTLYVKEWDLQLFPLETFYVFEYGEKEDRSKIGGQSFSVHHYKASWHPHDRMKWLKTLKSEAVRLRDQLLNLPK